MYEREVVNKINFYLEGVIRDKDKRSDFEFEERGYWMIHGPSGKEIGYVKGRYIDAIDYAVRRKAFHERLPHQSSNTRGKIERLRRSEIDLVKYLETNILELDN